VSSNTSRHPGPGQAIRGSAAPPGGQRPGEENNEKTAAISRDGLSLPLKESKPLLCMALSNDRITLIRAMHYSALLGGAFVQIVGGRSCLLQDTVGQEACILADETFDLVRNLGVVA